MSLHVAKFSFNVSWHLHPQLLIELPLLLYLRCVREREKIREGSVFFSRSLLSLDIYFSVVCVILCVCALTRFIKPSNSGKNILFKGICSHDVKQVCEDVLVCFNKLTSLSV